ncbi:DUF418 domain-containing protein [Paenibacillus wulumuqiensis]|uniref:DUF418 domain-containing protein n=1 Tax=Paenibacillus wulumuqiensis TaxID=1567107 RepID=UPI0006195944|nr:DUF418 domain-containing protein [Paenibacillus wulumuqiensis]
MSSSLLKSDLQKLHLHTGRITALDQLRGFALLAIFLVNLNRLGGINKDTMFWTYSSFSLSDRFFEVIYIIFGNSSRPLFAFMFGITMVIMYDHAVQRHINPYLILFRRMLILLLIGTAHYVWIWDGDILFMYAMDGLMLLLFISMSAWPLFLFGLLAVSLSQPAPVPVSVFVDGMDMELWTYFPYLAAKSPWFLKPLIWLHPDFSFEFGNAMQHLSFFLFGMSAYRAKLFHFRHGILTGIIGVSLLIIGIWGKYQIFSPYNFEWLNLSLFWEFSVSIGFVFIFLFLSSSGRLSWMVQPFAWIGRMSLTNYLLQSVVFSSIFVGGSMALLGKISFVPPIPFAALVPIGLFFFALQIGLSKLWLQHFAYGPVEWLWRAGTYWNIPQMRRRRSETADSRPHT